MKMWWRACLIFLALPSWSQLADPIVFEEKAFNFGAINEKDGPVEHTFTFTNKSSRDVSVVRVQASCGCTVPDWSRQPITPGQQGFVKARFDPNGRPGYFNKTLSVTTDWDGSAITLSINGRVERDAQKLMEESYPVAMGNLRLQESSYNMGVVIVNGPPVTKTFFIYNAGEAGINIDQVVAPKYIRVNVAAELPPRQAAAIDVTFDGAAKNQFGFASESLELHTNDTRQPVKYLPIYASLSEYFPPLSEEELKKAPLLVLDSATVHLGTIAANESAMRTVHIFNAGKQDLLIRDVQTNCSCLSAKAGARVIKPGNNTELSIAFNQPERVGTTLKAVSIYSNDPLKPALRLAVQVVVKE